MKLKCIRARLVISIEGVSYTTAIDKSARGSPLKLNKDYDLIIASILTLISSPLIDVLFYIYLSTLRRFYKLLSAFLSTLHSDSRGPDNPLVTVEFIASPTPDVVHTP